MREAGTLTRVVRLARLLSRPSVLAGLAGAAAGLLAAPVDGKTLRHRLRGVARAATATPDDPPDETD